ncbi:sensor histidine kinase [Mycolicibacterium smegmatis]|uniref:sensor histidine kinase n=1 Tax=Mycolicibacterium smegmatis TaxID=1772 RepID=UPI0005A819D1|nr:ATP-binding protein [Mycolicibacterium smegmatis]MBE9616818.1 Spo0B domain-containing protein [Mycolicibacterium smegmatis]MBE9623360.1 Spo0B domain-containing protein [Mycolicibacterium smegmatis]MBE9630076.1 Spo0B domain-containing protein [Mycolicibacterium smegmatis]MBE9641991.1 Spo0B domain-containing protein [Mycolicibacterium smegmatis]MBE9648402.1 Spo0B domain-containing protein [Mycolicibacterium smegmatis]
MRILPGDRVHAASLAGRFLVFQLLVVAVVLGAVAAISVAQSTREFRDVRGQRMIAVAENVASTPIVRDRYADPLAARTLAPEVDRAVALSGADLVEITDPTGVVRVSSQPDRIGQRIELDASRADEGRSWFGDTDIDGQHSLVGQVPILAPSGEPLAIVSVSQRYPSVWELLSGSGERLLIYLGIGAALGLLTSWLLSRRIKTHTRGLDIAEIADLADHREALLHSIREGVVAVNTDGSITVLNDSACELLGIGPDAVGRHVGAIGLEPAVVEFLLSGHDRTDETANESDVIIATRSRVLALNRRAASSQGHRIGTVTTMRDSTELAALQAQLSSHRSVTDTLRAQTHEFANQLHTISGLVQLGEYDAVRELVGTLTRRRAEINDAVTQHVSDPAVAALLIAKTSLAAESGVALTLTDDSHLAALDPALATDVITLLGNLVDNAVEVSAGSVGSTAAHVSVRLDDSAGLLLEVSDSGPGVPEHLRETIFARGVTSKPDVPGGRGIGLALVRLVTAQHGGTVEVTDGPAGGASFVVRLPEVTVHA